METLDGPLLEETTPRTVRRAGPRSKEVLKGTEGLAVEKQCKEAIVLLRRSPNPESVQQVKKARLRIYASVTG